MSNEPTHHDLVVIGSGSGNSLVTPDFAGRSVAVVDHSAHFGGTCLNVGCIPTKMFVYAAEVASTVRDAARFGVDATLEGVRWTDIRDRIFGRIDPISQAGRDYRVNGPGTTAYLGHARFTGERELAVTITQPGGTHEIGETVRVTADQVVVATGSRPMVADVIASSGVPFHTSDTVMRIEELPRQMVILGGGVISCEFAHVFSALGVEVTIIQRGPRLLTTLDEEIGEAFTTLAQGQWDVRTGAHVTTVAGDASRVRVALDDGSEVEADLLLVATGRLPNSDAMGLDLAGVDVRPDGRVKVDAHGRTSAEGVWALGDVSAPHQLKHLANHEARIVAHNLAHPQDLRSFDHDNVPAGVFSHPQLATVGLTEAEARAAGHDVSVKVQSFAGTAYGWAMEDTTSLFKLVGERGTGRLLGAHVMGPHATTLIQPILQAMAFGQTAQEVARGQYWIHPALAEVVENALLGLA